MIFMLIVTLTSLALTIQQKFTLIAAGGDIFAPAIQGVLAIVLFVLAIVLAGTSLGATGIWCAWPIGWTTATCMSIWFYIHGPWNRQPGQPQTRPEV
jgi:Na+-driven multidrug efflux pump